MRRYIKELRPTSVFDIAVMVALYRPGPMASIPTYIRRKHGKEAVTYPHPLLEPVLKRTQGIFVFQEDVMAASVALAGFSGAEADTLGWAIRKKKEDVLESVRADFYNGAATRGVNRGAVEQVFKLMEPFAEYGFNKAHATCYGLIAYQTAYLKANYTVEYMTSVLNAFRSKEEKVAAAIAECRRLGIPVLPPDVDFSNLDFEPEGEAIRFGLLGIKNVGATAAESIVAAREAGSRRPRCRSSASELTCALRTSASLKRWPRLVRSGASAIQRRSCSLSTMRSPAAPVRSASARLGRLASLMPCLSSLERGSPHSHTSRKPQHANGCAGSES